MQFALWLVSLQDEYQIKGGVGELGTALRPVAPCRLLSAFFRFTQCMGALSAWNCLYPGKSLSLKMKVLEVSRWLMCMLYSFGTSLFSAMLALSIKLIYFPCQNLENALVYIQHTLAGSIG